MSNSCARTARMLGIASMSRARVVGSAARVHDARGTRLLEPLRQLADSAPRRIHQHEVWHLLAELLHLHRVCCDEPRIHARCRSRGPCARHCLVADLDTDDVGSH